MSPPRWAGARRGTFGAWRDQSKAGGSAGGRRRCGQWPGIDIVSPRAAAHDLGASHLVEKYDCYAKTGSGADGRHNERGGLGASFLDHTLPARLTLGGARGILGARHRDGITGTPCGLAQPQKGNLQAIPRQPDGYPLMFSATIG